ncbi:hypothetical protein B9Z55_001459 [Caenorhabditis nigoni]|uniref:Uncharacterized protein n=1 Tax=Caenorhabditis nigoni TaxID=1611254 RepID=A0A2G5VFT4_9PELO|nr:hypothetical protein B9Z55_001459 [Caenorhabditis nigoni]
MDPCERMEDQINKITNEVETLKKDIMDMEVKWQEKYSESENKVLKLTNYNKRLLDRIKKMSSDHKKSRKIILKMTTEAKERERLLDVIFKDRDECLEEKMKVARFYRSELKALERENADLREKNKELIELEIGGEVDEDSEDSEDSSQDLKIIISEDNHRGSKLFSQLEATEQQIKSIIKKMSDLEVFMNIRVPSSEKSTSFFEKKNEHWDDLTRCSCNQIHETLDDLFLCAETKKKKGHVSIADSVMVHEDEPMVTSNSL